MVEANTLRGTANQKSSTTQIWVVTRHQYRIFALVSQTSFRGENGGGVAECRLFSQVRAKETSDAIAHTTNTRKDLINVSLLISSGEKRKLKVTFCLFRTSISFICFLKPAISSFFCFSRRLFSASSCSMRFLSCSPESWERNNKYNKKLQVLKKTFRNSAKPFWCKEFYLHENKKNHFHINGLRQVGNDLLMVNECRNSILMTRHPVPRSALCKFPTRHDQSGALPRSGKSSVWLNAKPFLCK